MPVRPQIMTPPELSSQHEQKQMLKKKKKNLSQDKDSGDLDQIACQDCQVTAKQLKCHSGAARF